MHELLMHEYQQLIVVGNLYIINFILMSSKKIKYYVIIASITGISIATAAFFQFSGIS
jgi:hypothetical protein